MKLTNFQKNTLKKYLKWEKNNPNFFQIAVRSFTLLGIALIIMIYSLITEGLLMISTFFIGLFLGILITKISQIIHFKKIWAALKEFIDWESIEKEVNK